MISYEYIEDFAERFHFIELRKHPDYLIKSIGKLFVTNKLIVVADISQKTVFVFDNNGEPKSKIYRHGNGPGEYPQMVDVWFDKKTSHIHVLDTKRPTIYTYSIEGDFIEEKKIRNTKGLGIAFVKFQDFYVTDRFALSGSNNRFSIFDKNLRFEGSYLDIPSGIISLGYAKGKTFDAHNDSLYYLPVFSDTVYTIHSNGPQPRYHVDVPAKNKMPTNFLNDTSFKSFESFSAAVNPKWVHEASYINVTDDYVSFRCKYDSGTLSVFYSKNSGKVKPVSILSSHKSPRMMVIPSILETNANFAVQPIHPTQFAHLPDPRSKDWTEETNAVLLFMKLKDF